MTACILEHITCPEDLLYFSTAFKEGLINLNISKIARELKIDRKTVKRYLEGKVPKKTRNRKKYLDDYKEYIKETLNDEYSSFDYIDHLYNYVRREKNITCNRVTFNRYIRNNEELNKLFKRKKTDSFTMRFETEEGQQAQFDLKEKIKLINIEGKQTLVFIPTLTLAWSRHNSRKLILDTKTEILLSYLAETFEELDGVPKELVIDNLKPFVEKPRTKNRPAILNSKFEEFCKDYGIKPITCMPARPKTKGKTETQNKIVDQLKNYNGKYNDIDDMHKILEIINIEDNEKPSQATKLPRTFLLQKEKGALNPLPATEIRQKYHLKLNEVHVSKESLISYKSNKYSVPKKYIGLKVGLTVIRDELHIYYNKKIITIHKITNNLLNIKPEHNLIYETREEKPKQKSIILEEMGRIKYD